MFHRSAIEQFQSPDGGGQALLEMLIKNSFAEVTAMKTDTFQGPRNVKLLMYCDTLKPYCVDERTTRRGKARTRQAALEQEESQFTSPFHIAIAKRQLTSIDYTNAYKGEIPPVGVKTDFYAVTFSYRLKADLPGLPKCNTVFKGKAKAFYDPDTGIWDAKVELDDGGGDEYLKLLAAQRERGP